MAVTRKFTSQSALILVALGVCAAASAVLFTFPANPLIWQIATWILVTALIALLALVLASAYVLATNRTARTWQRITAFLVGLACLVAVAIGSL